MKKTMFAILFLCLRAFLSSAYAQDIVLEAERGTLVTPFQAKDGYVYTSVTKSDPVAPGSATYTFTVPDDDNYLIQVLVNAPLEYYYFNIRVDGSTSGRKYYLGSAAKSVKTNGFEWRTLVTTLSGGSSVVHLTPGQHTVVMDCLVSNVQVDKIRLIKPVDLISPTITATADFKNNVAVMSADLKLDAQDNGGGCYMMSSYYVCKVTANLNKIDAIIKLPVILTPKNYYVFVKTDRGKIQVHQAGSLTNTVVPNIKDADEQWTAMGMLSITAPTDHVQISFFKVGALSGSEINTITGVFITDNPDEMMTATDNIIPKTFTPTKDDSAPHKGNLIFNSSFEAGLTTDVYMTQRYALTTTDSKVTSFASAWERKVAYDGTSSFLVDANRLTPEIYQYVVTRYYHLAPNKPHTFSVWMKAIDGKTANVTMKFVNAVPRTDTTVEKKFTVGSTWQRYSLTGYAYDYPSSDYNIEMLFTAGSGVKVWLDAMQLEEGDLSTYAPSIPVEAVINVNQPGHVFYSDEPVTAQLNVYNSGSFARKSIIKYEIYDYLNHLLESNSIPVSLASHEHYEALIIFSVATQKGAFRVMYWVEGENGSENEETFSVIPRPIIKADPNSSFMGIHALVDEPQMDMMKKLGIHSLRTLMSVALRWYVAEPTDDQFVYYDHQFIKMFNSGMQIMGTIGSGDSLSAPARKWAYDSNGYPLLDKYKDFVTHMVNHYKPWVKYWEIENEPNYKLPADVYAKQLKVAVDAIEAEDPSAKIVAMGGVPYQYMKDVIKSLNDLYPTWKVKEHIDILATHAYTNGTGVPSAQEEMFKWVIGKDKIVLVGLRGNEILSQLISEGILEDFSATGVRLKGDLDQNKVKIQLITKEIDFNEIWNILQQALNNSGLPVWNTETGAWDLGYKVGDSSGFSSPGKSIFPFKDAERYYRGALKKPESVLQNFLSSIGGGASKYFYYDARINDNPKVTHCTLKDIDDSIRPKGIAYAMGGNFIDYSTIIGDLKLDKNIYAYLFERDGVPVLGVWSKDLRNRELSTTLSSTQYQVFDLFGNPMAVSAGKIPVGRTPIYLKAQGLSSTAFSDILRAATILLRVDVLAPNVMIASAPRGTTNLGDMRIRWFGMDETSLPDVGGLDMEQTTSLPNANPNALQYSYRLLGQADAWSQWSANTYVDYPGLKDGAYTFEVQVKDEAGNISKIASRTFNVDRIFDIHAEPVLPVIPGVLGDVSGDSKITMYDAALVLRYTLGSALNDTQKQKADMNVDGKIDGTDVVAIAQKALGL